MFYAIVFKRDFQPGEHWTDHLREKRRNEKHVHGKHRVSEDDSDRKQHWRAGDLYSTGTVIGAVPDHLEVIEFAEAPPPGARWNTDTRQFVERPHEEVDAEIEEQIASLQAQLAKRKASRM